MLSVQPLPERKLPWFLRFFFLPLPLEAVKEDNPNFFLPQCKLDLFPGNFGTQFY